MTLDQSSIHYEGQFVEANEIASFFAYVKHELLVKRWTKLQSFRDQSIAWRYDLAEMAIITKLDLDIMLFQKGVSSPERLLELVKSHRSLHENNFWRSWVKEIEELISDLIVAPFIIVNENLIADIGYVYNEQLYRLSRRIGLQEFGELIGWSNRKVSAFRSKNTAFPLPVEHVAATPLWTVGQAEDFQRILDNRKALGIRGDWNSTLAKDHWHKITLVHEEDSEEEIDEDTVYEWRETNSSYYSSYRMKMAMLDVPLSDYERVCGYLMKRLSNPCRLQFVLGSVAISEAKFQKAEEYLLLSIENFEKVITPSLLGRVHDSMEDFYYAYLYYSFILARKGDTEEALNTLKYVQSRLPESREYIDFQEQIELLQNSPEYFIAWFYELHFEDMPDPDSPRLLLGKDIATEESRELLWDLAEKCNYNVIQFYYGKHRREVMLSMIQGPKELFRIDIYMMGSENYSASFHASDKGSLIVLHLDKYPKRWFIVGLQSVDEAEKWLGTLGINLGNELSCIV